ncbi:MAG TPA: family 20 glycosylhydrolase [Rhodanobacteraceae bacterium]
MTKWAKMMLLLAGVALAMGVQAGPASFHIIPQPQHLVARQGHFRLDRATRVMAPRDARAYQIETFLRHAVARQTGIDIRTTLRAGDADIVLRIDPSIHGSEAYHLSVTSRRIVISAADNRGLFWGVQTLRQLLPVGRHRVVKIPAVRIVDAPRYPWRGVMLDVSRHFFPVSYIKQQIALMSYYKFNVLHWHLTDDQGWRIQIKQYPKLTSVGGFRTEADGKRYGGYYTPQQIREVVAYARARNVMVVPEIEMPGHTSAAIAAYPDLSCSGKQIKVPTTWGVFRNVDCINAHTFTFLENVLDEVFKLFPSPYVHIGGDEVPQGVWADCKACKQLEAAKGLHGEQALHSYFVAKIGKFLASHGKTLVGWDEILEGGVSPHAIVEVWRGVEGAKQALTNGNRILIAGPFYLDASISSRTLQDLYRNDPFNDPRLAKYADQVLGGEAPLWAERVLTTHDGEAKLYPRLLAISEHFWNPSAKNWSDFKRRVDAQYAWLASQHVTYGPANQDIVDYSLSFDPGYHRWRIRAQRGFDDLRIHYTTDGSQPSAHSPSFGNVLDLYQPATVTVTPFRHGVAYEASKTFHIVTNLALGKPVGYATRPSPRYAGAAQQLDNGLLGGLHYGDGRWVGWQGVPMDVDIDLQQPVALHSISVGFLRAVGSWIELPSQVSFEVSSDGKTWKTLKVVSVQAKPEAARNLVRTVSFPLATPVTARYIRVVAQQSKRPISGGGTPYVFADEIIVH